jgi:predicted GIY-YIG superfamily endonuclease
MYYLYIVQCVDESLYTGITIDLKRRIKEPLEIFITF